MVGKHQEKASHTFRLALNSRLALKSETSLTPPILARFPSNFGE